MIVGGLILYRIPVYRCSLEKHKKELEYKIKERMMRQYRRLLTNEEVNEDVRGRLELGLFVPWAYNEVIAWLEITKSGDDILIACMMRNSKKFYRVNPGRSSAANYDFFSYKLAEIKTRFYSTSEDIFTELLGELDKINKEKPFHRRYFDMDDFRKVGKYIDWKGLTENINIP